ncbi:TetR/AcrR family transcriptional regulator [Leifsonia sp. fls2-241-R2A-40a]|uniref:TetR/AcrR family transcriptional regulator n=1 Tax=Leifsonia sp. fls2-241-R2A-40a TaxID=3040290 RepID=UPI00254B2FC0|nr:TetR/AcrR family transcriptional regulator [Leifsonia sp. fls2-241-R2A-40a]
MAGRRGAPRSEAARLAILDATAALFAERGYDHLSVEGIAARAGVGKQTVYRWWSGKSALIADCLLEGMLLPDRFVVPDTGDLRSDLTAWLRAVEAVIDSPSGQGLFRSLIAAATENEDVGRRLRESLADPRLFASRLRQARDAGDLRADLPIEDVSEAVLGALVFRTLARTPSEPGYAERLVDLVLGPSPS